MLGRGHAYGTYAGQDTAVSPFKSHSLVLKVRLTSVICLRLNS